MRQVSKKKWLATNARLRLAFDQNNKVTCMIGGAPLHSQSWLQPGDKIKHWTIARKGGGYTKRPIATKVKISTAICSGRKQHQQGAWVLEPVKCEQALNLTQTTPSTTVRTKQGHLLPCPHPSRPPMRWIWTRQKVVIQTENRGKIKRSREFRAVLLHQFLNSSRDLFESSFQL